MVEETAGTTVQLKVEMKVDSWAPHLVCMSAGEMVAMMVA